MQNVITGKNSSYLHCSHVVPSPSFMVIYNKHILTFSYAVFFCLSDIRDYCLTERFEASCPSDSAIIMTTALYGRMNYGECVTADHGYIGCQHDVLR